MTYIVSSIGRSGSTLLWDLIADSTGREKLFVKDFNDFAAHQGKVIKTHDRFPAEPGYEYRAVFVHDDILNVIASLFHRHLTDRNFQMNVHLVNLNIRYLHRQVFRYITQGGRHLHGLRATLAFGYLIIGDKFLFKSNTASWRKSRHNLTVDYRALINEKEKTLKAIGAHLGVAVKDFQVRARESEAKRLPWIIRWLVRLNYGQRSLLQ